MTPIFTESEDNGIYIAELNGVTDSGVTLNQTWKWNAESAKMSELIKLLGKADVKSIALEIDIFTAKEKDEGIKRLYRCFNEQVLSKPK